MDVPDDLRYHPDHHWARRDGELIIVGITDYAQDALGEVVWAGLPEVDATVSKDEFLCEVESVKTSSEVCAPVSGRVVEVNTSLNDSPEQLNQDPYGAGWVARIEPSEPQEWDELLDPSAYRQLMPANDQ